MRRTEAISCTEQHQLIHNLVKVHGTHQTLAERSDLKVTKKSDNCMVLLYVSYEKTYATVVVEMNCKRTTNLDPSSIPAVIVHRVCTNVHLLRRRPLFKPLLDQARQAAAVPHKTTRRLYWMYQYVSRVVQPSTRTVQNSCCWARGATFKVEAKNGNMTSSHESVAAGTKGHGGKRRHGINKNNDSVYTMVHGTSSEY